jgi:hypothetical protein
MLLKPPVNAPAKPPEAVCDNKLVSTLLLEEVDVLLLEGLPN